MDSRHDPLTGLYNRNHWLVLAEGLLARSKEAGSILGVISINIDGMKPFNDMNGKSSGDNLIVGLAQVVQSHLPAGAIAARSGGDDFLVAVPATEAEVVTLAEAIRYQAKEVVVMGGSLEGEHWDADPVTLTLGLSFYPRQGSDLQPLIAAADEAVQRGKQAGGNCVI